jgi:hypothetical protein
MTVSLKTTFYADQADAAREAAHLAICKPEHVAAVAPLTPGKQVGPHLLQKRIETEYSPSSMLSKNREKLIQVLGVALVALSVWVIGYSLYAQF